MATLNWIGKEAVVNHDKEVPFKLLDKVSTVSVGKESKNLIIHGDNLEALKALMPFYKDKVNCIYIDPPYNTGNEKWIYNDRVNSPKIREWLGKVVGGESDDLTHHDKWLCMMYPRLRLLRDLLTEDGAIFISIDDNEFNNLIGICNEIFGEQNRFAVIIVRNNPRGRRMGTEIAVEHEYLISYVRDITKFKAGRLQLNEDQLAEYSEVDKNGKIYRLLGLRKRGALSKRSDRPNLHYPLFVNPRDLSVSTVKKAGSVEVIPKLSDGTDGVWRWGRDKVNRDNKFLLAKEVKRKSNGQKEWDVFEMNYAHDADGEVTGRLFPSIWEGSEFNNETGRDQIRDLFGKAIFDYPKPVDLIKHAILLGSGKDAIILDSFTGSGTTGQAVLELNQRDNGNRKFILVEMEEKVAKKITAERIKRVIKKSSYKDGFEYCELAKPLFNEKGQINEACSYGELASYIYFTETQTNIDKKSVKEPFVGESRGTSYYLIYAGRNRNDLTRSALSKLKVTTPAVIYADRCLVDEEDLKKKGIVFKQIPYEVKVY